MVLSDVNLSFGEQEIFKNLNLTLSQYDKIGVVGVNGAGKTTLFRMLIGEVLPDSGKILFSKNERLGYLPQIINLKDDRKVLNYIYSARPIEELQKRAKDLEEQISKCSKDEELAPLFKKYDNNRKLLDYWDEYSAESTMYKIIAGLGIKESILNLPVNEISGGEKSKVAFARLLFQKPDVILLDEPTNHLDKGSRDWIINYLKNYKGALLVISHDVDFLNQITNKTLLIDKQTHGAELFNGNYDKYIKLYEEYKLTISRQVKAQKEKEKKLVEFIRSVEGGSSKRKKLAKSREKELEKLRENMIEEVKEDKKANIKIKSDGISAKVPLIVNNLTFAYKGSKNIINKLSFSIDAGDRLLVAGVNGAGKSTLLKLIAGELTPNSGQVIKNEKTKIGYYDQEQKNLYKDETILNHFLNCGWDQSKIRAMLSRFLFFNKDINKKLSVLSPGERCRIAFAELAMQNTNLLLLDEPTNHLDPATQDIIANNFYEYDGTIILVSHNPNFVEKLGIEKMLLMPSQQKLSYKRDLVSKIQEENEKKNNKGEINGI